MEIKNFLKKYQIGSTIISVLIISFSAQIRVEPFLFNTKIPITMQSMAILMIGFASKKNWGWISILMYLLIGFFGVPVFSNYSAGISKLTGATGGYLVGFLLAGLFMLFIRKRNWHTEVSKIIIGMALGTLLILLCGWSWLSYKIGMYNAFYKGILPFLPGAVVKIVLGSIPFILIRKNN